MVNIKNKKIHIKNGPCKPKMLNLNVGSLVEYKSHTYIICNKNDDSIDVKLYHDSPNILIWYGMPVIIKM